MNPPTAVHTVLQTLVFLVACAASGPLAAATKKPETPWSFTVSGDSRNCGNVVMPAIAAGTHVHHGVFLLASGRSSCHLRL